MTDSSFNKYVKQNATEFNKEYAKYEENSIEISNKTDQTKEEVNKQSKQTVYMDYVPQTRTASQIIPCETKNIKMLQHQLKNSNIGTMNNIMKFIRGYCFSTLRKGICYKQLQCRYKNNVSIFIILLSYIITCILT